MQSHFMCEVFPIKNVELNNRKCVVGCQFSIVFFMTIFVFLFTYFTDKSITNWCYKINLPVRIIHNASFYTSVDFLEAAVSSK